MILSWIFATIGICLEVGVIANWILGRHYHIRANDEFTMFETVLVWAGTGCLFVTILTR